MKRSILLLSLLVSTAAFAKLPAPVLTDEAKAKAAEAAAKTAWAAKVDGYKLCLSMDKAAAHYQKTAAAAGKAVKPATATPPCADPGPFVWPAPATAAAAAPATPAAAAPAGCGAGAVVQGGVGFGGAGLHRGMASGGITAPRCCTTMLASWLPGENMSSHCRAAKAATFSWWRSQLGERCQRMSQVQPSQSR